ncbi:MAG: glycosyltransferase family 1 protein [Bacteroidales bacterium]|jgi:hypothetical protein|nr:glycosyltransferase family 1 protein [Bacteroidales bacterium]
MNNNFSINIISFNVPYPPNYGGTIDIFYKIKTLNELGVKIHLHCFYYNRDKAPELNKYCESVNYYNRDTGFKSNLSFTPYIIASRKSDKLAENLLKNDFPIIFEGLHSCFLIDDERFKDRLRIYRESNIEHEYYYHLGKSSKKFVDKFYYFIESFRLKLFQKKLRHADIMLVVSRNDQKYLQEKFPDNKIYYIPSFHGNEEVVSKTGKGEYLLYHGNLSVEENIVAANYLINNVFSKISEKVIIAGLDPDDSIKKNVSKYANIELIANPDENEMRKLIENAHINILYTQQATGLKLKLLNVLYQGRFVLVNSKMCAGTNLNNLCIIADTSMDMINKIEFLFKQDFSNEDILMRNAKLDEIFNDKKGGQEIISLIEKNYKSIQ